MRPRLRLQHSPELRAVAYVTCTNYAADSKVRRSRSATLGAVPILPAAHLGTPFSYLQRACEYSVRGTLKHARSDGNHGWRSAHAYRTSSDWRTP